MGRGDKEWDRRQEGHTGAEKKRHDEEALSRSVGKWARGPFHRNQAVSVFEIQLGPDEKPFKA